MILLKQAERLEIGTREFDLLLWRVKCRLDHTAVYSQENAPAIAIESTIKQKRYLRIYRRIGLAVLIGEIGLN